LSTTPTLQRLFRQSLGGVRPVRAPAGDHVAIVRFSTGWIRCGRPAPRAAGLADIEGTARVGRRSAPYAGCRWKPAARQGCRLDFATSCGVAVGVDQCRDGRMTAQLA
jgi:hypothetical protein